MLISRIKKIHSKLANLYYEEDYIIDKSMRFIAKEVIRFLAMKLLRDELLTQSRLKLMNLLKKIKKLQ